ncbi:MAG: hypothetical protein CVV25_03885 [Ignavibacteriae bacterium HGW-Ignavibacteriae-4]|jgi:hypothetical protein|nr:MAG: hypothetical protein CVV25_03885 [Ignavibacteriae bacterium HGW-Ignavibacteriae-4]
MKSLTVFFNSDKVYSGIFERNNKGLALLDISSTLDAVNLDDIDDVYSKKAINQLNRNLTTTEHKIEELNVILNNESAFWTIIPGKLDMDKSKLKELLALEIKGNNESFNISDFSFRIYPYGQKDEDDSEMLFVVFIRKSIIENCKIALEITGLDISYITMAQIASQNTIEYNYPDTSHLYDLLINVEDSFCDISLSNNNTTYFYDLIKNDTDEKLIEAVENEITKLKANGLSPGNALVIGTNLRKSLLDNLSESLNIEIKRLNSFRLVRANIDDRLREYCIRTSHIYSPVVGGSLNSFDKGKVFEF